MMLQKEVLLPIERCSTRVRGLVYCFRNRELGRRLARMNRSGLVMLLYGMIAQLSLDAEQDATQEERRGLASLEQHALRYLCSTLEHVSRSQALAQQSEGGVVGVFHRLTLKELGARVMEMRYDEIIKVLSGMIEVFQCQMEGNDEYLNEYGGLALNITLVRLYYEKMFCLRYPYLSMDADRDADRSSWCSVAVQVLSCVGTAY